MVTYKVGDTIEYTTFGGDVRRVTVTAKHRNVKNGRAGFDAAMNNSDGGGVSVWGYDADVLRVILPTGEALVEYIVRDVPQNGSESREWARISGRDAYHVAERTRVELEDKYSPDLRFVVCAAEKEQTHKARASYQGEPGLEESKGDSIGQ